MKHERQTSTHKTEGAAARTRSQTTRSRFKTRRKAKRTPPARLSPPRPAHGSLVLYDLSPHAARQALGLVVSNNIQNEIDDSVLIAPLEHVSRQPLAPFMVPIGQELGFKKRYRVRCDRIAPVAIRNLVSIERAQLPTRVMEQVEYALKVALGFRDVI